MGEIMIFDTHAHYDDERFAKNLEKTVEQMKNNDVAGIITCGTSYEGSENALKMCEKFDIMYAAVGVYPHEIINSEKFDRDRFLTLLSHKKAVAVGEIGLDYFYDDTPKEMQLEWIEQFLQLSNESSKAITFHDRDAHADTIKMLKKYKPQGVVHCFSGSVEMAKEITALGMSIGVGGVVTFKNASKLVNVVKEIPLSQIVLETDAPYMAPEPVRGTLNRSDYIHYIAEKVAQIKSESVERVCDVTTENAMRIFKIGV